MPDQITTTTNEEEDDMKPYQRVLRAFDHEALGDVCAMHEDDFAEKYGLETWTIESRDGVNDKFYYIDNGSNILAVAHLDTVGPHEQREAHFVNTEAAGPVVYSRALDDRLGAYTILELLPAMGIKYDILLTTGEESGQSTAEFFEPPEGKEYHWMIEFDRGGTDVVMYQYEDSELKGLVKDVGASVGIGAFSDISYMSHLEIKGLNWGVGYREYHGPRAHAYLQDYWMMLGMYVKFHERNADTYLPHDGVDRRYSSSWGSRSSYSGGGSSAWSQDSGSHGKYGGYGNGHWWDDDELVSEVDRDPSLLDDIIDLMDEDDDDPDDLVSDDFNVVNRELTAAAPPPPPY